MATSWHAPLTFPPLLTPLSRDWTASASVNLASQSMLVKMEKSTHKIKKSFKLPFSHFCGSGMAKESSADWSVDLFVDTFHDTVKATIVDPKRRAYLINNIALNLKQIVNGF